MAMKITVIGRTMNEERNIRRFICGYHDWVDEILIADGGSTDDTLDILAEDEYFKVSSRNYEETFEANGIVRNPQGKHVNYLIDWAHKRGADWIIFDDVDCFPTVALQERGREIMESAEQRFIFFKRMYCYLDDHWFPSLSEAGHSLYAWRAGELWADEQDPMHLRFSKTRYLKAEQKLMLNFPLAGLHCTWPTEAEIQRKMKFYETCWQTQFPHPTVSHGPAEPLPTWARDS